MSVELDRQGWILAPKETLAQLLLRKQTLSKKATEFPLNTADSSKAHKITENLYQFTLKDIPILYSGKSLSPWEGAVLWSYVDENEVPYPVIQMKNNYKKGFLRLYKEEEVLAHELVHAARFAFKEPFFEEMFAYKTSTSFFPRFFGPLFVFRIESLFFICLIVGSFLGFIILEWILFLWLPFLLLACFLFRLLCLHLVFSLAKSYIAMTGAKSPLAVLFRFSDKNIWEAALTRLKISMKKLFTKFY